MVTTYAVMDLHAGQVVHAVAGQRECYQPIRSRLAAFADPHQVAAAVTRRWGIRAAYVADLDALAGAEPDVNSVRAIMAAGMQVILDAGVGDSERAAQVLAGFSDEPALSGIVVALESCRSPDGWAALVTQIGAERAVFSLDLRTGQLVSGDPNLARAQPLDVACLAWQAGFRQLIVLDVASVGRGQGPSTIELCRQVSQAHSWSRLLSGGGVRGEEDIQALAKAGCDGVLVASMLHV